MVSGCFEVNIVYWHMIPADQLNATGNPSHKNPFRLQVRHTDNGILLKIDNIRCHADKTSLMVFQENDSTVCHRKLQLVYTPVRPNINFSVKAINEGAVKNSLFKKYDFIQS